MHQSTAVYLSLKMPLELIKKVDKYLTYSKKIIFHSKILHRKSFKGSLYALKFLGYSKPSDVVEFSQNLQCPFCRLMPLNSFPTSATRWRCFRQRICGWNNTHVATSSALAESNNRRRRGRRPAVTARV
jgi:hypothetical protein